MNKFNCCLLDNITSRFVQSIVEKEYPKVFSVE